MTTRGDGKIDVLLQNVSLAYKNGVLINSGILKEIPVQKQSDKLLKYGKESFRIGYDLKGDGVVSKRIHTFSVSTDSYRCEEHALHDILTPGVAANFDSPIQAESATTMVVTDQVDLNEEKAAADALFNETTFASYMITLSGADKWSEYSTSNPINQRDIAFESVRQNTGAIINTVVMGQTVYNKLVNSPTLLEQIKYTKTGQVSKDDIARAFQVQNVYVGSAVYNTENENSSFTSADIWGDYCLFCYIAPSPGLMTPSLGYKFKWTNAPGGGVAVYREDLPRSKGGGTFIEVAKNYGTVILDAAFGYLFKDLV